MIVQLLKPYIDKIGNDALRVHLREYLYFYEKELDTYPASMSFHHTYTGGLKDHIIEVCRLADSISNKLMMIGLNINTDAVYTACMIHDMSKVIQEYEKDIQRGEWRKKDNLVKGRMPITHEIVPIIDFPKITGYNLSDITISCLLSHMGGFSQSGVYPDTIEQAIVHSADLISSRMSPHVF